MTVSAFAMMLVAIFTVWGGLVGAVMILRQHPEPRDEPETPSAQYGAPRWWTN